MTQEEIARLSELDKKRNDRTITADELQEFCILTIQMYSEDNERLKKEFIRASTTLIMAGFIDNGGELWKPPIGKSVSPLIDEIDKVKSERQELLKALTLLLDITQDSQGVAGYHLNGVVAEWDEFEEVSNAYELISLIEGGKS